MGQTWCKTHTVDTRSYLKKLSKPARPFLSFGSQFTSWWSISLQGNTAFHHLSFSLSLQSLAKWWSSHKALYFFIPPMNVYLHQIVFEQKICRAPILMFKSPLGYLICWKNHGNILTDNEISVWFRISGNDYFCITVFIFTIKTIKFMMMWHLLESVPNRYVVLHLENKILMLCRHTFEKQIVASCDSDTVGHMGILITLQLIAQP